MFRFILLAGTHGVALALGFALGIYLLPILTAPPAPETADLEAGAQNAVFEAEFTRDLAGSDFAHWGEGTVAISDTQIVYMGRLSPGPDYKLYLVPEFAEDEAQFNALKDQSVQIGDVKSFDGFILDIPAGVDLTAYNTILVWCEAFGEFITAGQYR